MERFYAIHNTPVFLGYQGEENAREVAFDVSHWLDVYGEGNIQLFARRPGETTMYPIPVVWEGGCVVWRVTSADVELAGQTGQCELSYTPGDDTLVKSETWATFVLPSMDGDVTEVPDAAKAWIDALRREAATNQKFADAAAKSAAEAAQSAGAAGARASAAGKSAEGAERAKAEAEQSAKNANAGAGAAERSAALAETKANDAVEYATDANKSADLAEQSAQKAATSAEAAEYYASVAKDASGGDFVTRTELPVEVAEAVNQIFEGGIDCGLFTDTESIAAHNEDTEAHETMTVDGNATVVSTYAETLDEHESDENAHPNLTVDGNAN